MRPVHHAASRLRGSDRRVGRGGFFHGDPATSLKAQGPLRETLRGLGSRGELSEAALHKDAECWYQEALARWKEHDVVLVGRSFDSGIATPVAAKHPPRLLILGTPFAYLYEVATNYLPILPHWLLLRYPFRNDIAIKRIDCPVYILHGKFDNVVL